MPIANRFLKASEFDTEYLYELSPAFCSSCHNFQIVEQPDPKLMFHNDYTFFTRTSQRMVTHFNHYADWLTNTWLKDSDPFVVEIGSNDGAMLENFAKRDVRHLGIEPSGNTAELAEQHGVSTLKSFFNAETAATITGDKGAADAIIAANVICHIPDLHSVVRGVDILLKPKGVFVFEEPYLGDMIEKTAYDQLYDEHIYMFSLSGVSNLFSRYDFEIIDVLHQETHGGSMRYVIARSGTYPISEAVYTWQQHERSMGIDIPETYSAFKASCEKSRENLLAFLVGLHAKKQRVIGYAATSKSTTVLNYCNIGPELIEFITDITPEKQGRYTPGTHIPVVPVDHFHKEPPNYAVLFAWNHQAEIFAKERDYIANGGKWILVVPTLQVIAR